MQGRKSTLQTPGHLYLWWYVRPHHIDKVPEWQVYFFSWDIRTIHNTLDVIQLRPQKYTKTPLLLYSNPLVIKISILFIFLFACRTCMLTFSDLAIFYNLSPLTVLNIGMSQNYWTTSNTWEQRYSLYMIKKWQINKIINFLQYLWYLRQLIWYNHKHIFHDKRIKIFSKK